MTTSEAKAARRHERRQRFVIIAMVSALVVAVGLNVVLVLRPEPFDPLSYEPQPIERLLDDGTIEIPTLEGFATAALNVGDIVPVRASYNVDSDAPVRVIGSVVWVSVDPPGLRCSTEIERIPGVLAPGPHLDRFENEPPACVLEAMAARGVPVLWSIRGLVEVSHPRGVAATWSTEPFWYVP